MLSKRTVQKIRRNTKVRFRVVVQAYVSEECRWILANLIAGKRNKGWKEFVEEVFEGKTLSKHLLPQFENSALIDTSATTGAGNLGDMSNIFGAGTRRNKDEENTTSKTSSFQRVDASVHKDIMFKESATDEDHSTFLEIPEHSTAYQALKKRSIR
ncbi:hypothetical protein PtrSN002B_011259 [Pyrenophora tritici-repentis]|nr:hypothetical protein PtrSN001C_011136 [Pyrenophora tritici-repentis]KAI1524717.1 hypothetical protein PtrSN001A_010721 [Pyrenophora tritici-repentis]KAI1528868.1 hypothetical protein PtrSN002B_011259 [Pyrenophora tritici-repentis]KAI1560246.1 hypothetical protein PtrEW4_011293 [Pyrenophora tritici-repentis]KAI1573714.1 hypothetical protein PtrEW13061_011121 [Pyrenophora tritici-repentis]